MINEQESKMESYLLKIVEQNDTMINLLKTIAFNTSPAAPTEIDEGKAIQIKFESLTKRERQVIELLVQGMMNKEMAYQLSLSLSTIEAHRSSIMKKMEAKNVAQLTVEYMKYQSLMKFQYNIYLNY